MSDVKSHMELNKQGHLDENSLSEAADWLNGYSGSIDPLIEKHLKDCFECRNNEMEVSELASSGRYD